MAWDRNQMAARAAQELQGDHEKRIEQRTTRPAA